MKNVIMLGLVSLLVGCCGKPHYENVDAYPVKQGSLEEMVYSAVQHEPLHQLQ